MQRNLALELVRVTEAAALAGGKWYGKGDKNAADQVTFISSSIMLRIECQCLALAHRQGVLFVGCS